MKYSVVIPTFNPPEDLLKPFTLSVIKNTDALMIEFIMVANVCPDRAKSYV